MLGITTDGDRPKNRGPGPAPGQRSGWRISRSTPPAPGQKSGSRISRSSRGGTTNSYLDAARAGLIRSDHPGWGLLDSVIRDSAGAGTFVYAPSSAAGDFVGISFCLLRPPATSHVHYCRTPSPETSPSSSSNVSGPTVYCGRAVATHHNTILLSFIIYTRPNSTSCEEFFVYKASPNFSEEFGVNQASSLPMLVSVPSCGHTDVHKNMGILCPGDHGEFAVAHLVVTPIKGVPKTECPVTAELCCMVMDGHDLKYCSTKPLRIHYHHGEGENLYWWQTDAVIPIDDNTICWVDYLRGILVCSDALSPDPVLIYIQLPVDPLKDREDKEMGTRGALNVYRNVCVTQGGDMKFVDLSSVTFWFFGKPPKQLSVSPYSTINTWTLSRDKLLSMIKQHKAKSFAWMKDGTLEEDEFIALTKSHNIPYAQLGFPLVDIKNPQSIYVMLRESCCDDKESYLIAINMSAKRIDTSLRYNFGRLNSEGSYCCNNTGPCKPLYSCNVFYNAPFLCFDFSKYLRINQITYPLKAVCVLGSSKGVKGTIYFTQEEYDPTTVTGSVFGLKSLLEPTTVTGRIFGLKPGLHRFISIGPHYNPAAGEEHRAPEDENGYFLGNVTAGADGVANVDVRAWIPLTGTNSIIGKAVVVHDDHDDLGKAGHEPSKSTENAGGRIACGIITLLG